MGDNHHRAATTSSRMRIKHLGGEIVEVEGGHIVRSTGRKDRHSKVCTAKGPRDRRVRLSAHTAIQFYDVQDRLGYDRPSKAVDWLIKKAKSAIDELAELPPWNPLKDLNASTPTGNGFHMENKVDSLQQRYMHMEDNMNNYNSGFLPLGADFGGNSAEETGRFQRLFEWNGSTGGGADTDGGVVFGTPLEQPLLPPEVEQNNQFLSQRGPLQSSNTPFVRAWIDQPIDEYHHRQAAIGFTTSGVFPGFRVPSRIQGEEEERDSFANKLSSDSHH